MNFSIRLARAAAWMTWMCLLVSVVAVFVMAQVGTPHGLVIHPLAYYLWAFFGVGVTLFLSALPALTAKSSFVFSKLQPDRQTGRAGAASR